MSALRLHVKQRGSGRYVVLVHGWGLDSRVWDTFRGKLADGWRVVTVDLPGYGRSPWNAGATSLDPMAEALAEALPKDAVWVGWSLGGLVASHVACRYPERVRGLVLIASAPRFSEAPGWGWGMATPALRAFAKALREDRLATLERFVRRVAQGGARARFVVRYLRARLGDDLPDRGTLLAGLKQLEEADLRSSFVRINCPALQVLGAADELLHHNAGLATRTLHPALVTEVIPGAAHAPFISHPKQTLSVLKRFLDGLR